MAKARIKSEVSADTSKFERGISRAKRSADSFKKSLGGLKGAAAGAALLAIGAAGSKAAREAERIKDLSDKSGLTTDEIQAFNRKTDQLADAAKTLRRTRDDAINGNKEYLRSFDALGISIEDVASKSIGDLLEQIGRGIKTTGDMGNASKLLGESVADLTPEMDKLASDGFGKLIEGQRKLGQVMDEEMVVSLQHAKEQIGAVLDSLTILFAEVIAMAQKGWELISDIYVAATTDKTFNQLTQQRIREEKEVQKAKEEARKKEVEARKSRVEEAEEVLEAAKEETKEKEKQAEIDAIKAVESAGQLSTNFSSLRAVGANMVGFGLARDAEQVRESTQKMQLKMLEKIERNQGMESGAKF